MTGGIIFASLCIAPHHGATQRPATQRSDFPDALAPGWPENHPMPQRAAAPRFATRRNASQRSVVPCSASPRYASRRNVAHRNANPERT